MKNAEAITCGTRFTFYGNEFEITYVANAVVRYASSAGGQAFRLPYAEFEKHLENDVIKILESAHRAINESSSEQVVRAFRYTSAARCRLIRPNSKRAMKAVIAEVAEQSGDTSPPSPQTVARWLTRYADEGISGMHVRYRRSGNRSFRFGLVIEQIINDAIGRFFLRPERCSAKDILAVVAAKILELGMVDIGRLTFMMPSLRTIQRRLKQLDPIAVIRAQRGGDAARRAARAAGQKILSEEALLVVQMDSHYLDVLVVDPDTREVIGRPYLVCLLDVSTRCVVGWHISMYPPSSITALAALKDMLTRFGRGLPGGVPVHIVIDLGIEFTNCAFTRCCAALKIIISYSQVREPNGKGNLERFFGTLAAGLIHKLFGTTFSNPTKRGIYASQKKAMFTLQDVTSFIEEWIEEHYHREVHTGTGRAPIIFWSEQIAACSPMTLTQEEADALARRPVHRQIRNGQVTISGISYLSHALKELQLEGENLVTVLVDDLNLNSVLIQHPSEKNTLIRAYSNEPRYTEGLTSYAHEQAQEIRKELAEADRCKLGQIDNLIALGTLLERIHGMARTARKKAGRLTNGMGKIALKALGVSRDSDVVPISSSSTVRPSEQLKVEPDSNIGPAKQVPSQPQYFDTFSLED